jgi:nucleoside-diphosphate-sugar epimerase
MISILGCGWYGLALGNALALDGYEVKGSTTSPHRVSELTAAGLKPYIVKLSEGVLETEPDFFNCDTLVVSIPPKLRSGYTDYIPNLQQLIAYILKYNIKRVIFISSTGVYPESNSVVDEGTIPQPNSELGKTLLEAEELFRYQTEFKTAIIRFGGLVGPGRHPGRFFAGKKNIPNGQAPVNLIHLQDCIVLTQSIIKQDAFGYTFNACSPHHPAKAVFYTVAAQHAGLPIPEFIDELKEWKTVTSINTTGILNFEYKVNNWQQCFEQDLF